jgi:hypothetical protein
MGALIKLESPASRHGLTRHTRSGRAVSTLAALTMLIATVFTLLNLARRQSFSWLRRGTSSSPTLGALKFQPDGTFQISIFEDLHFGERQFVLPYATFSPLTVSSAQMLGKRGDPNKTSSRPKSLIQFSTQNLR